MDIKTLAAIRHDVLALLLRRKTAPVRGRRGARMADLVAHFEGNLYHEANGGAHAVTDRDIDRALQHHRKTGAIEFVGPTIGWVAK